MTVYCIVAEGDSVTYTAAGYFYSYFSYTFATGQEDILFYADASAPIRGSFLLHKNSPSRVGINLSLSGTRLISNATNMTDAIAGKIVAYLPASKTQPGRGAPARKYILTLLAGTNPDTTSPTTHAANVAIYAGLARAAGIDAVLVGTLPSRTDGIIADFDTSYQAPYNAIIKGTGWKEVNNVAGIIDFASNANIGATGAADNTTYFADKVHPTAAGHALMTPIYAAAVNAMITSLGTCRLVMPLSELTIARPGRLAYSAAMSSLIAARPTLRSALRWAACITAGSSS
jgi:lysophospholipase L1-like esterase